MARRQSFQTIAWFHDLYKRALLDLDPPYQRRSVWNQEYKDYFIDTILLDYPAPAIFIYEEIDPNGVAIYKVVDGKQRLTTIFEFIDNKYPIYDKATLTQNAGKYFNQLEQEVKRKFWAYDFLVEYLHSNDENIINDIFNRINKNVAKLTPQELRHAKFDGEFIRVAEYYAELLFDQLPKGFPRIGYTSLSKMKDVELVADLLLLIENGPQGYNQIELDQEFSSREDFWDRKDEVVSKFDNTLQLLKQITAIKTDFVGTRFKNQNDFYSLFGALLTLIHEQIALNIQEVADNLMKFVDILETESERLKYPIAIKYWENVRTAPNQTLPRKERIEIILKVFNGEFFDIGK